MNYIEEMASEGMLEAIRFAYDAEAKAFLVNEQPITLSSVSENPGLFAEAVLDGIQTVQVTDLGSMNFTEMTMLSTPRFFDWLMTSEGRQAVRDVPEVTHQAFNLEHDRKLEFRGKDLLHGFGAAYLREGHVTLSTVGSCACLGVVVDGHMVNYSEWGNKYAEYEFHNIDFPAQKISLLAGLGHLAFLSDKSA